ncbi:hypothetical protein HDU78_007434 [Chytriomyces hyalinus]|nr:hypothetical protein HDU78_007434 [Chytriomyces hyalinus]
MGNVASLAASAQDFFTIIVSGRSLFVGSAFSIFLASLIAPFLADIILGVIAMALSSKGFVHVAVLASAGPIPTLTTVFRVTPEGRNKAHFGVGFSVLVLAIVIAAVPAAIHQLLVPMANPPIATVWPLNAKTNEVAFSEIYRRKRSDITWCVPTDGPMQSFASSSGTAVSKFSANPNCKEGLSQKLFFPAVVDELTPSTMMAALKSSTMTRLGRVSEAANGAILGIDVAISRKTDIKYAIAKYYEGLTTLSPSLTPGENCDGAVTTVVTILKTNRTPTATEVSCTAYGVDNPAYQAWEYMLCYDHGGVGVFTGNRTVAIFVAIQSQVTDVSLDFVYHAIMPESQQFRLLTDWERQNFTALPTEAKSHHPIKMEDMRLLELRVDDITIQEFLGLGDCRVSNDSVQAFLTDVSAQQYVLGAWQQSASIVHTSYSKYETVGHDKVLVEFTNWQGILFMSLFLVAAIVAVILRPSMAGLLVNISCSNSLAFTSLLSKPWYTKTGFFVRQNAQGDMFVSCEEDNTRNKPLTFKQAERTCQESETQSGYGVTSSLNRVQPYEPL